MMVGVVDEHAFVAGSRAGIVGLQLPVDVRVGPPARSASTCPAT
jgi:hypothetical protein